MRIPRRIEAANRWLGRFTVCFSFSKPTSSLSSTRCRPMPRILVVEDEPAIAESISYGLRRDGYTVAIAPTLADAERELEGIDLVVLDLMLPDGSGFDLLGKVRQKDTAIAVIVLSSRDAEADRVAALETGADDYVTKPFSPREIVARVRAVLRRAHPRDGAAAPSHPAPSLGGGTIPPAVAE